MERVKDFIINFIERDYSLPEDLDLMNLNYAESGYVDSISMIQFIVEIEEEFNITFSNDELNDPDIKIVGKLIELVNSKISNT